MTLTSLRCGTRELTLGSRTYVMGIVNVTPDSFSDGGAFLDEQSAVDHALSLLDAGADILDIGGESTRPGAQAVAPHEECARVLPVIDALVERGVRNISIDTRNAITARAALDAGASWVNDVSALLHDADMAEVARRADAVVLMHWKKAVISAGAHEDPVSYSDVVKDVARFLEERCTAAVKHGIAGNKLVIDPGIGFGKTVADNVRLLSSGERLSRIAPVLIGPSRKRFLGALTGIEDPKGRDGPTHVAIAVAALSGAHMVRVHDVKGAVAALKVVDAARSA